MKLYKLRPLSNFEFALDIAINERLYCAHFGDLNDPFEGVFMASIFRPSILSRRGGTTQLKPKDVSALRDSDKCNRVCSLSGSVRDVRQWSHYADGHKGIAIEIDFSGHESDVVPIKYISQLEPYRLSGTLFDPIPERILSQKTVHWQYEDEHRVLQSEVYYSVKGRISSVLLGARISDTHKSLLDKVLPNHIAMIETAINEKTLDVETREPYERQFTSNK